MIKKIRFFLICYHHIFTPKNTKSKKEIIFRKNDINGDFFRPSFETKSHFTIVRIYNITKNQLVSEEEYLPNEVFFLKLNKNCKYRIDYINNEMKTQFLLLFE